MSGNTSRRAVKRIVLDLIKTESLQKASTIIRFANFFLQFYEKIDLPRCSNQVGLLYIDVYLLPIRANKLNVSENCNGLTF